MKLVAGIVKLCLIACWFMVAGPLVSAAHAGDITLTQVRPSIDCTCRYKGQDYQQGDLICLNSPDGPQLAECGFVLNNTSWNFTGMGCLFSAADRYAPPSAGYSMTGPSMTPISIQ